MITPKPILKWPGGKRKLAPAILDLFEEVSPCGPRLWVEPFVGGASMPMALAGRHREVPAVLSDSCVPLVNLYSWLRLPGAREDVLDELGALPSDGWRAAYYDQRDQFNRLRHDSAEQAARMIWLNRACTNGLWRTNSRGEFNASVGTGDQKTGELRLPGADAIHAFGAALLGHELRAEGFRAALGRVADQSLATRSGVWVYLDPPYVPASETASFVGYSGPFDTYDHTALHQLAVELGKRGATVVMSNSDTPGTHHLYPASEGWRVAKRLEVNRSISFNGSSRKKAAEVLMVMEAS